MLFSVVIPAYNRLTLLKEALASVFAQTFTDYEIVVVDDGSTDATADYVRSLDAAIKLISQPNRGPGAARNRGVQEAQGRYVAFLDSDDLWFPWTLSVFAEAIGKIGAPTIIHGSFVDFSTEDELDRISREPLELFGFRDYFASSRRPYSVGSGTCAVSREVFRQTEFLVDRLNGEDHDFIMRLGAQPGFVHVKKPATLAWRRHRDSETANIASAAAGTLRLLRREGEGAYPGGMTRAEERRRILARHARPTALACLRQGRVSQGWEIYNAIFLWNLRLGHWPFLLAFPLLAVPAAFQTLAQPQSSKA